MIKNQIKEKLIVESQAYCERKHETSIHEILSNGLYLWLGTFEIAMREIWLSFTITTQDKEMKIREWNMEFIVGVQSLTQHSKGK